MGTTLVEWWDCDGTTEGDRIEVGQVSMTESDVKWLRLDFLNQREMFSGRVRSM